MLEHVQAGIRDPAIFKGSEQRSGAHNGASGGVDQDDRLGLAGSSYQQFTLGTITGRPPRIDFDLELQVQGLVRVEKQQ